jgi:hypothetical protein
MMPISDLAEDIVRSLDATKTVKIMFYDPQCAVVRGVDTFITIFDAIAVNNDPWAECRRSYTVTITAPSEVAKAALKHVQKYPVLSASTVEWNYLIKGDRRTTEIFLDEPRKARPEFYPFLNADLDAYIDAYLEDEAAILFLRGEPGTGKTSFIQHMIWRAKLKSMVTYEEGLFKSDEMFVAFLTNPSINLLIMEDADVFLLSREKDQNPMMAKFLNISEGVVRFPRKKIAVSTNLIDEKKIDPALMRRGRCYDAIKFRKLTADEAVAAAEAAGRTFEPEKGRNDYSLAEALGGIEKARSRVGFGFNQT